MAAPATTAVEDLPGLVQRARESALLGDYERGEQLFDEALRLAESQVASCRKIAAQRRVDPDVDDERRELDDLSAKDREARRALASWEGVLNAVKQERATVSGLRGAVEGKIVKSPPIPSPAQERRRGASGSAGRRGSNNAANHDDDGGETAPDATPVWRQSVASNAEHRRPTSGRNSRVRGPGPRRAAQRAPSTAASRRESGSDRASGAGPRTRRKRNAAGKGAGEEPASYAEAMEGSPDLELIKQIESTMLTRNPNVHFDEIAGLQGAQRVLQEAVLYPQIMPQYYKGIRRPWKGVLLFGPPGTGKTMLAKAIASECETCFFNVASSSLTSKWRGESEKMVSILFDMARFYAPSTIFIDEVDSIASARGSSTEHEASRRVKSELLTQMDGVSDEAEKTVIVLAATNLPWDLDDAIRRRLEKRIYIPLPDAAGRRDLFKLATRSVELEDDVDFDSLARLSDGYSGADISNVCTEASMMPVRRIVERATRDVRAAGGGLRQEIKRLKEIGESASKSPPVAQADFEAALENVQSSVGDRDLSKYQQWMDTYGAL